MKCWSLFIFSVMACVYGWAQSDTTRIETPEQKLPEVDSVVVSSDSLDLYPKRVFQPQLFVDYGKLITTAIGLENKLEGGISIIFFEKFEATAEFGKATLKPEHAYINGNYQSYGNYLRFGGGLITDINAKSSIGIGVRYGLSRFQDQGRIEIQSASGLQDDFNYPFNRSGLSARWWSAVLTSESRVIFNKDVPEAKINHLFKVGFFFRMRFLVTYENNNDPVEVYSIPGYGSANSGQQAAFNLFIKFTP
jgi:hypothetical protein